MKKLVDKSIDPADAIAALQAGGMTLAQAQRAFNGIFIIGAHKGVPVSLDITTLIEPLVLAEQLHILGLLDGREEDYDKQTITIPNLAAINAQVAEQLTVPAGLVAFITAVELVTPADKGGTPAINWHCSLWTDRAATPSPYGQPYHNTPLSATPNGDTFYDEFSSFGPAIGGPESGTPPTNKPVALRLPAGAVLTFVATNLTAAATADMVCTAKLYGYIGKSLVA